MLEAIAFYTFCALTLAMFLVVVTTRNILYALSALAAGMIFVFCLFSFCLEQNFWVLCKLSFIRERSLRFMLLR